MSEPMIDLEMMMNEPLCQELAACLVHDGPLGPFVKHPLVFGSAAVPGHLNRQLEHKKQALITALAKSDWHSYIWLHERPYRLPTLWELCQKRVTMKSFHELLIDVWQDTEMPHQFGNLPCKLFKLATQCITDDKPAWNALPDILTIYRGGYAHGISWTTSKKTADWFARRFYNPEHFLWTARIAKHRCFAYITSRGEAEVVVEWKRLNVLSKERVK